MQFVSDKIKSLTGFAIKAGKIIFGSDNIVSAKRKYLIIVCRTLSENGLNRLKNNCSSVPLLKCVYADLSEVVYRNNCKAIAFTDKQMSEAVLNGYNNRMYDLLSEVK